MKIDEKYEKQNLASREMHLSNVKKDMLKLVSIFQGDELCETGKFAECMVSQKPNT